MTIFHCEFCNYITHLKNNYNRHKLTKKHLLLSGEKLDDEQLNIKKEKKRKNKEYYDKMRTPEYIEKANKKRRDEYKNDEAKKVKILSQCAKTYDKHKIKYRKRNNAKSKIEWWANIISSSKYNDKKYERFEDINYIDKEFLINQKKKQNNKCIYCDKIMTSGGKRTLSTLSIERIDNNLGHLKDNCVFACWGCNHKRHIRCSFEEFKNKFN